MPYVETLHDFCFRHGAAHERDRVRVSHDLFLLPDGAAIRHNQFGADILLEPPDDLKARLEASRKYHEVKLARIKTDFAKLKAALTRETLLPFQWPEKEYGEGPADGKAALLLLKELAKQHRSAIAGINAEIEALPGMQERRRNEAALRELDHEARMRAHELQAEIEQINL